MVTLKSITPVKAFIDEDSIPVSEASFPNTAELLPWTMETFIEYSVFALPSTPLTNISILESDDDESALDIE